MQLPFNTLPVRAILGNYKETQLINSTQKLSGMVLFFERVSIPESRCRLLLDDVVCSNDEISELSTITEWKGVSNVCMFQIDRLTTHLILLLYFHCLVSHSSKLIDFLPEDDKLTIVNEFQN